MLFIAFT